MTQTKKLLQNHGQTTLLWLSLAIGLLAAFLFIGRPLGISWLIFIIALLALLLLFGRRANLQTARRNLWLWPPLLFFATMVFLRANPFLTFLNIIATLVLLAFVFYFYAAGSTAHLSFSAVFLLPWRMAGSTLSQMPSMAAAGLDPLRSERKKRNKLAPVLRGALLALPLIFVFTLLLASADLVLAAYLQQFALPDMALITPYLGRGLFVLLIGMLTGAMTAAAVLRGLRKEEEEPSYLQGLIHDFPRKVSLGSMETSTIMLLVSALFVIFVALQFTYLFGGEANINREGFTYAEYARRGFSELVLVASLSLALILFLNWITRRDSKRQIKLFNGLSTLLIALVLLILATAFWRMRLYEQAYGYTELRLLVLVFELWLAVLLLWLLFTLWRAPELFAAGFLVVAICFVATLNMLNPDALIVRHNMARYRESGSLDVFYLTSLSADAVPALVAVWNETRQDQQRIDIAYCYEEDCTTTIAEVLGENLRYRYEIMNADQQWRTWPAYHKARRRAYHALVHFHGDGRTAPYLGPA